MPGSATRAVAFRLFKAMPSVKLTVRLALGVAHQQGHGDVVLDAEANADQVEDADGVLVTVDVREPLGVLVSDTVAEGEPEPEAVNVCEGEPDPDAVALWDVDADSVGLDERDRL